jgi:hypothetical protein
VATQDCNRWRRGALAGHILVRRDRGGLPAPAWLPGIVRVFGVQVLSSADTRPRMARKLRYPSVVGIGMGTRDERDVSPPTPSASEDDPSTTGPSARQAEGHGRRSSACPAHPLPTTLTEAIEAEREHLLQVQAMARCLYEVLLYSDDDDGVMHADVAQVIARLIRETVSRLERIGNTFGQRPA